MCARTRRSGCRWGYCGTNPRVCTKAESSTCTELLAADLEAPVLTAFRLEVSSTKPNAQAGVFYPGDDGAQLVITASADDGAGHTAELILAKPGGGLVRVGMRLVSRAPPTSRWRAVALGGSKASSAGSDVAVTTLGTWRAVGIKLSDDHGNSAQRSVNGLGGGGATSSSFQAAQVPTTPAPCPPVTLYTYTWGAWEGGCGRRNTQTRVRAEACGAPRGCRCIGRQNTSPVQTRPGPCCAAAWAHAWSDWKDNGCGQLQSRSEEATCAADAAAGCACTGAQRNTKQTRPGACCAVAYRYAWPPWPENGDCGTEQTRRETESCAADAAAGCVCSGRRARAAATRPAPACPEEPTNAPATTTRATAHTTPRVVPATTAAATPRLTAPLTARPGTRPGPATTPRESGTLSVSSVEATRSPAGMLTTHRAATATTPVPARDSAGPGGSNNEPAPAPTATAALVAAGTTAHPAGNRTANNGTAAASANASAPVPHSSAAVIVPTAGRAGATPTRRGQQGGNGSSQAGGATLPGTTAGVKSAGGADPGGVDDEGGSNGAAAGLVVGIIVTLLVVVCMVAATAIFLWWTARRRHPAPLDDEHELAQASTTPVTIGFVANNEFEGGKFEETALGGAGGTTAARPNSLVVGSGGGGAWSVPIETEAATGGAVATSVSVPGTTGSNDWLIPLAVGQQQRRQQQQAGADDYLLVAAGSDATAAGGADAEPEPSDAKPTPQKAAAAADSVYGNPHHRPLCAAAGGGAGRGVANEVPYDVNTTPGYKEAGEISVDMSNTTSAIKDPYKTKADEYHSVLTRGSGKRGSDRVGVAGAGAADDQNDGYEPMQDETEHCYEAEVEVEAEAPQPGQGANAAQVQLEADDNVYTIMGAAPNASSQPVSTAPAAQQPATGTRQRYINLTGNEPSSSHTETDGVDDTPASPDVQAVAERAAATAAPLRLKYINLESGPTETDTDADAQATLQPHATANGNGANGGIVLAPAPAPAPQRYINLRDSGGGVASAADTSPSSRMGSTGVWGMPSTITLGPAAGATAKGSATAGITLAPAQPHTEHSGYDVGQLQIYDSCVEDFECVAP